MANLMENHHNMISWLKLTNFSIKSMLIISLITNLWFSLQCDHSNPVKLILKNKIESNETLILLLFIVSLLIVYGDWCRSSYSVRLCIIHSLVFFVPVPIVCICVPACVCVWFNRALIGHTLAVEHMSFALCALFLLFRTLFSLGMLLFRCTCNYFANGTLEMLLKNKIKFAVCQYLNQISRTNKILAILKPIMCDQWSLRFGNENQIECYMQRIFGVPLWLFVYVIWIFGEFLSINLNELWLVNERVWETKRDRKRKFVDTK